MDVKRSLKKRCELWLFSVFSCFDCLFLFHVFIFKHINIQFIFPFCIIRYWLNISKLLYVKPFLRRLKSQAQMQYSNIHFLFCSSAIIQTSVGKACMCDMRVTKMLQKSKFSDPSIYCLAPKFMWDVFLLW